MRAADPPLVRTAELPAPHRPTGPRREVQEPLELAPQRRDIRLERRAVGRGTARTRRWRLGCPASSRPAGPATVLWEIGEWLGHVLNVITGRMDRPGGRRFEPGYVDAYYGPPEWAEAAKTNPRDTTALAAAAAALPWRGTLAQASAAPSCSGATPRQRTGRRNGLAARPGHREYVPVRTPWMIDELAHAAVDADMTGTVSTPESAASSGNGVFRWLTA